MEIAIIGGGIAGLALALNWHQRGRPSSRSALAARVVETNRTAPPDFINIRVEELTGDRTLGSLGDFISQEELRAMSDRHKRHRRLQHRGPCYPSCPSCRIDLMDESMGCGLSPLAPDWGS